MDFCIESALLSSQLPDQLFTFILNSTGIRRADRVPGVTLPLIDDFKHSLTHYKQFKHSLSYYKQYKWQDCSLNLTIDDIVNSIFFNKSSLYKLLIKQDKSVAEFLEILVKDYTKSKDGLIIRKMLLTGTQKIIDFNHNVEPIIILKERGKLTIVDGLHRILSLFVEKKTESVVIKAWHRILSLFVEKKIESVVIKAWVGSK
jgi:hypothetical protein